MVGVGRLRSVRCTNRYTSPRLPLDSALVVGNRSSAQHHRSTVSRMWNYNKICNSSHTAWTRCIRFAGLPDRMYCCQVWACVPSYSVGPVGVDRLMQRLCNIDGSNSSEWRSAPRIQMVCWQTGTPASRSACCCSTYSGVERSCKRQPTIQLVPEHIGRHHARQRHREAMALYTHQKAAFAPDSLLVHNLGHALQTPRIRWSQVLA